MSITIISSPINFSPVHSPCIYTVSVPTALRNETEFRYIARVFDGGTFLGELKSFPNPLGGWGKFDVGDIIASGLEAELTTQTIANPASFWKTVEVRFGWEYINSNGNPVRVNNDTQSSRVYWLAAPSYDRFLSIRNNAIPGFHPYVVRNGISTTQPLQKRRKVQLTTWSRAYLSWLRNVETNLRFVRIIAQEGAPTIPPQNITVPVNLRDNDIKMISVRVDRQSVISATGYTDLQRWIATPLDAGGNVIGATTEYEIIPCGRWEQFVLYWINDLGGIETLVFNGRSDATFSSRKDNFKQSRPDVNASGIPLYNIQRHTTRPYNIGRQESWELWSDWVDDKEVLKDIISSPYVWLHKQDRGILPIIVDTSTFRIEDKGLNRPVSVNFNVTYEEDSI